MNDDDGRQEILALMHKMETRPLHVQHVTRLALQLFDDLILLHGLGPREQLLLEGAGHLHDIGHQSDRPGTSHHRESARLIREHPWSNFTPDEVEVMAQVAHYHRKAIPELDHEEFKALPEGNRRTVQHLAALLRLADALDRSHEQLVQRVRAELSNNLIVFHVEATDPVLREILSARQKGDLAMAIFQRDLIFMVGDEVITPPAY